MSTSRLQVNKTESYTLTPEEVDSGLNITYRLKQTRNVRLVSTQIAVSSSNHQPGKHGWEPYKKTREKSPSEKNRHKKILVQMQDLGS